MCDDRTVSWHELANALSIVQEVITASSNNTTRNDDYDDWGHMALQPAYRLAEARNHLRTVSGDENPIGSPWSLETLMWKFQDFEASDPRDAIYALLALANDRKLVSHDFYSLTHIPIDYSWFDVDVFKTILPPPPIFLARLTSCVGHGSIIRKVLKCFLVAFPRGSRNTGPSPSDELILANMIA